ncbi:hypothetical protein [Rhodanobacter sp. C01]|uniref:hypothetical protein n=1 Tax=Rhodanobacter sp. C01 TaxID=1945856 RepID=UPI00111594E9|nr:hypothetical protein [Rhodanobacter sp. C01]
MDSRWRQTREVFFRMTIRAKQNTFRDFCLNISMAAVRYGTNIEVERLHCRVDVVPCQRSQIPAISASRATPTGFHDQLPLALQTACLLAGVTLVAIVGVFVFAASGTKPPLSARQGTPAYHTAQFGFHQMMIIQSTSACGLCITHCYHAHMGL